MRSTLAQTDGIVTRLEVPEAGDLHVLEHYGSASGVRTGIGGKILIYFSRARLQQLVFGFRLQQRDSKSLESVSTSNMLCSQQGLHIKLLPDDHCIQLGCGADDCVMYVVHIELRSLKGLRMVRVFEFGVSLYRL